LSRRELAELDRRRREYALYQQEPFYERRSESLGGTFWIVFIVLIIVFAAILAGLYYSFNPLNTAAYWMFAGAIIIAVVILFAFYYAARRTYSNRYGDYDFDSAWGKAMLGMLALGILGVVMVAIGAISS
jgi:sterol desaturase/sphingolipid hydroxylase (fatty acid hydroxylase superfamily)